MSDSCAKGERQDRSGDTVAEILSNTGSFSIEAREVVPDEESQIISVLTRLTDDLALDLVLTTGGTGLFPRDVTPEATKKVIEKEVPGIPEIMRLEGLRHTPRAALSRGVAGIRGKTLVVNLPGSIKAVRESLTAILPILGHAVEKVCGDPEPCGG